MYKKVIATGGIISSLLFTGGSAAFAQTNVTPPSIRHNVGRPNANRIAKEFGLDASEIKAELEAGKKLPEILAEHGISKDKLMQISKRHKDRSLEKALDVIAPKLGLNADDIRAELQAGKTFKQILEDNGISKEQVKETLNNNLGRLMRIRRSTDITRADPNAAIMNRDLTENKFHHPRHFAPQQSNEQ